tara:strand:+ start:2357 stop:5716 length:3360 start_codon:yes stop_codon:yes gene_type:complete
MEFQMKKLFSILVFILSASSIAQLGADAPWMQELMLQKNGVTPTYEEIKAAGESYWQVHDKDAKGSGYKPFMRWVDRAEAYVKADGTLQSALDIQNELQQDLFKNNLVDNSNWVPVGPFSFTATGSWSPGQGRVNTLVVDPNNSNTYYMGTPGGGAWKSTDAGTTWSPITDFLSQIGTSAIAVDPNNSNVVYIGTGDDDAGDTYSIGMLKSTDAGATFNTTGLTFSRGGNISEIYIDPNNSNNIYISSSSGFYKSTDAGTTVTRTFNGNVKDIKFKPGDSNVIYMATLSQFFKSTNQGATWTQITSGLPTNQGRSVIGVSPANSSYVYLLIIDSSAALVGVYRSNDDGVSFSKRDTGTDILESSQGWYDLALEVSPTNAETIYTGCLNVWKSTSGGSSFTKINSWSNSSQAAYTHADIHQIRQFGNELFVLSDGGVYRSTNAAASFTDLTSSAQIGQFYRIAVGKQSSADIAGGLQDNGGFTRSASSWKNYYGADGMESGIDPTDSNIRYGFTQRGGGLYISTNGGNSLSSSINGPEQGNWITPMKTDSRGTIYAGYSMLYKVVGGSFTAVSPAFNSNIDVLEIDPNNDNVIYAAVNEVLYRSIDAGANFISIFNFPENISALEVNANNSSIVYAATRFSDGQVYKSTNQGASFSNITSNLPNLGKNTLVHQALSVDEPLFVGTTVGTYRYDESVGLWESFGNNLPNVNIRDLEINTNDNTLTAGTYGRGIWQTAVQRVAPNTDVKVVELLTNGGDIACGNNAVNIILENAGMTAINSVDINYSIDGGTSISQQTSVSIAPQGTASITIPGLNLTLGTHTIDVIVTTINDYFSNNNEGFIEILSNSSGVVNDLHQFENRAFLTSNEGDPFSAWQRGTASGAVLSSVITGSTNVYGTNISGPYGNNSTSYLYSGCYDLSNATNPVLSFDMAFDIENNWDLLYMEYSIDGGGNWNILGSAADPNWYNSNRFPNNSNCYNCIGAQWTGSSTILTNYNLSLSALNNPTEVVFRYVLRTDQSVTNEGAVIDNFVINGTLSTQSTSLEDMFSIYPNPSAGVFNIAWNAAQEFDYSVYDVSGKKIAARKKNSGTTHQVDLSGVSQGMYFINISTATGSVTQKLIVR